MNKVCCRNGLVTALLLAAATVGAGELVYNAGTDFSYTNNPNGVWSYGYTGTELAGSFTAYPINEAVIDGFGTTHRWLNPASPTYGDRVPGVWEDPYGTTTVVTIHPGNNPPDLYSSCRFTAPSDGLWAVSLQMTLYDSNTGGADGLLYHNGSSLWSQSLSYNVPQSHTGTYSLAAGDTLDFMIGPGAAYYSDSTRVFAEVQLVPEPTMFALGAMAITLVWRRRP